jgi:hypothetical protein
MNHSRCISSAFLATGLQSLQVDALYIQLPLFTKWLLHEAVRVIKRHMRHALLLA